MSVGFLIIKGILKVSEATIVLFSVIGLLPFPDVIDNESGCYYCSRRKEIFKDFVSKESKGEQIEEIAFKAKNMCNEAGITLPNMINFEVSHHYGIDEFKKFGMVLVTIINRIFKKKYELLGMSNR